MTACDEHGSDNVGRMGVESANATGHGRADQILGQVKIDQRLHRCLEYPFDNILFNNRLTYDRFASTFDPKMCVPFCQSLLALSCFCCCQSLVSFHLPVNCRGLFVRAIVATEANYLSVRKVFDELLKSFFGALVFSI